MCKGHGDVVDTGENYVTCDVCRGHGDIDIEKIILLVMCVRDMGMLFKQNKIMLCVMCVWDMGMLLI